MNNCCVLWSREACRLEIATMDEATNINRGAFLDDAPGKPVIATHLTEDQARQFIRGYAAVMAARSQDRVVAS
jgi:hypothetical protein